MSDKNPTPDDLWQRAELLFDQTSERNGLWDELDDMYDAGEHEGVPDGIKMVRSSHFTNAVDLVVDLASQQELTIDVPLRSESEAAEKEADEQERFLQAWLRLNDDAYKQNTTAELAYLATQRAVCIARVLFKDSALKQKESDQVYEVAGLPLIAQVRDPRYCAWSVGVNGLEFMAERFERRVSEIRSLYPDVLKDEDKWADESDVEWTEIWTPTHVVYFAANEPVPVNGQVVRKHGYGCIPYAMGVGRMTPRLNAKFQPLMRSSISICRNMDTWYSILLTSGWAAVTSAWNVFSDGYPMDGSKTIDTGPGAINFFARGDAVQPLQRAPLPQDFFQAGDRMLQQLQQATFPFAMFGQVEGNMAGYAINLLTQSGRRALAPIWHAVESCYEGIFRILAIIGRNKLQPLIGDNIPLVVSQEEMRETVEGEKRKRSAKRTLSFRMGNIGDDWTCKVKLGDPMPSDAAANLRMAIESTQAGLLSKRTARSKFGLTEDDAGEQERINIEKVIDQLVPLETVKLATKRGYVPRKLELPVGWKQLPDGNIVPDLGNEPEQGQAQGQGMMQPGQAGPGGQGAGGIPPEMLAQMQAMQQGQGGGPPQQGMPQGEGMPQLPPGMTPEMLMQMMAEMQGGQEGQGVAPEMMQPEGMPPEGINPADMQALSGQPQAVPSLDEMAGEAPMQPGMM